ncbi:MAG: heavy metal-associated domain-containing protein [Bacteriovoracales bacterium]|nr:heavy metal-associated domain-containing protein [Bacteriovoracales bacterium]
MKRIFVFTLFATSLSLPQLTWAQKVILSVPGMVCQMCVHGMRKAFKDSVKNPETDVIVNLDTKVVTLDLSRALSDDDIRARVKETGYNVAKIKRMAKKVKGQDKKPSKAQ